MPPKNDLSLSDRELQTLALAWQCMATHPQVDLKKLALLTGYTDASCQVTFGKIKKKLANIAAANGGVPVNPPARSKASAAATKKSKSTASASSPNNDNEEAPKKKRKASGRPASEATNGDENETGMPSKKRKAKTSNPKQTVASANDEQPLSGPEDYNANDDIVELNQIKLEMFE